MPACEATIRDVWVGPGPLRLTRRGAGPDVVLLHGLGAASCVWDRLELPGHRLLCVDLPGHGASLDSGSRLDPAEIAARLDRLLESEARAPYAVIGHSFGAVVALELARRAPNRVRAAMFVNAAVRLPRVLQWSVRALAGDTPLDFTALLPVDRRALRLYLGRLFGDPSKVTPEILDAYLQLVRTPGYHRHVLAGVRGLAAWSGAATLTPLMVPTAVVWGTRDRLLPVSLGRELAARLGATFHPIEGCGHSPPEERPEVVSAVALGLFGTAPLRS